MNFSVITVTFNNLIGLKETYNSLRNQDFDDWEWIIVDGNSNDGTVKWLENLDFKNCNWISEPDKGIFDAMNKGILKSKGDYLIFMNGGDEFYSSDTLSLVSAEILKCRELPAFIYGDALDVSSDGKHFLKKAKPHRFLYKTMFTSHQAMFFNRQFGEVHHIKYPLEYRITGDYAYISLYFKNIRNNQDILYIPIPVCKFLLGGTNEIHRFRALKEDFVIRRKILGLSFGIASMLYILHYMHTLIKRILPSLAKSLRYKKS